MLWLVIHVKCIMVLIFMSLSLVTLIVINQCAMFSTRFFLSSSSYTDRLPKTYVLPSARMRCVDMRTVRQCQVVSEYCEFYTISNL